MAGSAGCKLAGAVHTVPNFNRKGMQSYSNLWGLLLRFIAFFSMHSEEKSREGKEENRSERKRKGEHFFG